VRNSAAPAAMGGFAARRTLYDSLSDNNSAVWCAIRGRAWDGLLRSAVGRQTTDYWDGSEAPGSLSGRTPWLCAAEASSPVTVLELVDALIAVSAVPAEPRDCVLDGFAHPRAGDGRTGIRASQRGGATRPA
jgi:hypothetical protein